MAAVARDWAAAMGERLGLPVTLRDERLSSYEAERRLGGCRAVAPAVRRRARSETPSGAYRS